MILWLMNAGKTNSSDYVAAFPPGTEPSSGQIFFQFRQNEIIPRKTAGKGKEYIVQIFFKITVKKKEKIVYLQKQADRSFEDFTRPAH